MPQKLICLICALALIPSLVLARTPRRRGGESTGTSTLAVLNQVTTAKIAGTTIGEEIKKADTKIAAAGTKKIVSITMTGEMKERGEGGLSILGGRQAKSLKEYLDLMRRAREDNDVKGVVLRFTAAEFGLATAQELRGAVDELRAKGKKTYGIVEDDSQASYLTAIACDEVILPPSADLMIYGVKADAYFFKSLLEKLGVNAQIIHVGQYKSYGEMFTEDDFTSPARANMTEIVDDVYSQMVAMIASSRKLTPEKVGELLNRGPASAQEAKADRLVDRVAYADELFRELEKGGNTVLESSDYTKDKDKGDDISLLSLFSMLNKQQSSGDKDSKYPQVAVVYAVGEISLGTEGGMSLSSDEGIYSDDFIDTLDDIMKDSKIKAVILRIDSPGGSAFASDLIWRKVQELKKQKPVVVSMGDVAASGGYYIAMGANKIIAQGGTFTGSIGVVGGKVNLSGGYSKLGIRKTTISKGQFANLFSETSDFSPPERAMVEKMMRKTYDEFVSKASEGRHVSRDKLNEVAQGKVWIGAHAKQVGLVDEIGGLAQAIQETKSLIGLRKDEKVALVTYPKEVGLMDILQKAFGGSVIAQSGVPFINEALPAPIARMLRFGQHMAQMLEHEHVIAVMPFIPSIQ